MPHRLCWEEAVNSMQYIDKAQYEARKNDLFEHLKWGYVNEGDIIWIPFGFIMVEKCVGSTDNLTLRAPSMLFHEDQMTASIFYASAYPKMLRLKFKCQVQDFKV